jgi:hypothetical protein
VRFPKGLLQSIPSRNTFSSTDFVPMKPRLLGDLHGCDFGQSQPACPKNEAIDRKHRQNA